MRQRNVSKEEFETFLKKNKLKKQRVTWSTPFRTNYYDKNDRLVAFSYDQMRFEGQDHPEEYTICDLHRG